MKLRFGRSATVHDVLRRNHGQETVSQFRRFFDLRKKKIKCELDLDFLLKCKTYEIFPKFLRFKLYKRCFYHTKFYKCWQTKLLNEEIKSKRDRISVLSTDVVHSTNNLKESLSLLEFYFANNFVKDSLSKFYKQTKQIHDRKLHNLGIHNNLEPCDPNKVIFNYSSRSLSTRVKFLLAFGLDFGLPVYKLDYFKYFLGFEKLASTLQNLSVSPPFSFSDVKKELQAISFKYFYGFKPFKVFSTIFSKDDVKSLKSLAADKSLVICKPDKGRGVVVLDRSDYVNKVTNILSDSSRFRLVSDSIIKTITQVEDKINRFLSKMKRLTLISETLYNSLFVSGSLPGILYGLPKVHKTGTPIRPIFAACNTPSYNISKFLVPVLSPLTRNEYTVSNSYDFSSMLGNLPDCENLCMASFDVESLFTNIPLHETIDICLDSLFCSSDHVIGLPKKHFKTLLELSVLNSYFIFDGKFYVQTEGVGMGLPLGPTFANIFMCFNENKWLNDCPSEFRPVLYKRYVDDCFVMFRCPSHAHKFLDYLNNQHPKIKFTMEMEQDQELSFLDVNVKRCSGKIETSVYRKPSFTGLGTSFFSFVSYRFKICAIKTLIHRAYHICSNFQSIHREFNFIKSFFKYNGFPESLVNSNINKFLNKIYDPPIKVCTVSKLQKYVVLPYFGPQSEKLKKELCLMLSKFYSYMDVKIVLKNSHTIGSLFRFKDRIPIACQSSVVYSFCCASCDASYIGSTKRSLHCRFEQHLGRSHRTGMWLSRPDPSPIRSHADTCTSNISIKDFKIIGRERNLQDLRLLESLHILKHKPNLNDHTSAVQLNVVV